MQASQPSGEVEFMRGLAGWLHRHRFGEPHPINMESSLGFWDE